ncbi:MAG: mevalonate kinase family protein [Armatimonadota bacterium]
MVIHQHVGARVGLVGNPSDGFGGKTISALIDDFTASVTAWESPQIEIIPHPRFDPFSFRNLDDLVYTASLDGYYGGLRLLYATCKRLHSHCEALGIDLPRKNFTLEYDINIPRQVGLAGSSAITVAALKSLMRLMDIEHLIPLPLQPTLALEVETRELHIQAGLQDRVVQVYGGLVYMDFDPEMLEQDGYGHYEPLELDLLPPLYLAYTDEPSDSGKVHSGMRTRFDDGDPDVRAGMREFASYADEAYEALLQRDYVNLGRLMNANFDLRRKLYGDAWIGERNLEMVQVGRSCGLPTNFTGSGGAIVGFYEDDRQFRRAARAFADHNLNFRKITPVQVATGGHIEDRTELHRLHRLAVRSVV